jgi:hypothetical protein
MLEIQMSLSGAKFLASEVWEVQLAPSEVRRLGDGGKSIGAVSIVLLSEKPNTEGATLRFNETHATVLNVGATGRTLIVDGYKAPSIMDQLLSKREKHEAVSSGDRQFLDSLERLPAPSREAGENLLREVRAHFRGELKRITAARFQETPDNFWFVTVQPRAESILVTVRGLPERFKPSTLAILEDRRPYSRFKVRSLKDIPEAVRIIRSAIRK